MVTTENGPSKRVKRSRVELHDFHTFPAVNTAAGVGMHPFRSAVRGFLTKHARVVHEPSELFPSLVAWQILFSVGGTAKDLTLDVVEEDVQRSRSVYCNQCRVVGWSRHPVCNKRYHFIIRGDDSAKAGYPKPCSRCGNILFMSDLRCKSCELPVVPADIEDRIHSLLEDNFHLLHGVVHSNGYGHLLSVNGREGGSNVLSGREIVDFWDRLCGAIAVRKVTVMDMSKKYGVAYRVLHAIVKGHSWYGDWGYEFGSGSYGITIEAYRRAVSKLSNIPLSSFLFQGRGFRSELQTKIAFYRSLSDVELLTVRDLFVFLLGLIGQTHKSTTPGLTHKKSKTCTSDVLCVWTRDEVDRVQQSMVSVLQAAAAGEGRWVTRRALKGATCKAASPELLDYSLKHLGGKVAANGMIVRVRCSVRSNSVEFRLEPCRFANQVPCLDTKFPTKEHIMSDLKYFYDSMLNAESMASSVPKETRECAIDAATKLLDCKQFVKDYEAAYVGCSNSQHICVRCRVVLYNQPRSDPLPPSEPIVLPLNATVGELKREVAKAFQETYVIFKRFQVNELLEYGHIDESITLSLLIGTCGSVAVRGKCFSKYGFNRFRMERGIENWIVDCKCGAKDDDGERMLACDSCGVWQHTRCAGIDKSNASPIKFFCSWCPKPYPERPGNIYNSMKDDAIKKNPPAVEDYPRVMECGPRVMKYDPQVIKDAAQAVNDDPQAIGCFSEAIKYYLRANKGGSQEVEDSRVTYYSPRAVVWGSEAIKYDLGAINDGGQEAEIGPQEIKDGPQAMDEDSEAIKYYPGAIKDDFQEAQDGPQVIEDSPQAVGRGSGVIKYYLGAIKDGCQEVEDSPQAIKDSPRAITYNPPAIKDGFQEVSQVSLTRRRSCRDEARVAVIMGHCLS